DYRDTKIVSLAKKCRNLTRSLNKERGLNQSIKDKINTRQDDNGRLKRELDLVSSPAARAAATRARESKGSRGDAPSKDSAQLQKQVEDLRRKLTASQDETKKLSRALAKELGEGVSVEQAVDDGWRGRAQQIVMLKAKVKRLEAGQTSGGVGRTRGTRDVDAKAEEELQSMSAERQQAVEALTEDHQRLSQECGQLQHKLERQKARVRALESDSATHKQQLKVLVEKAESDDALIEALQKEVQSARSQLDDSRRKLREQAEAQSQPQMRTMRAADGAMACAVDTSSQALEAELNRMRRLCKQQAAQLETQETVIQKLRASAAKSSRV
ncbi:CCDC13, partial [Symbiodinium microadriaticum]